MVAAMGLFTSLLPVLLGFALPFAGSGRAERIVVPIADAPGAGGLLPISEARGRDRPIVVIDPGHGGRDPGSASRDGRLREKDLTLKIAQQIAAALTESGRVRVALTRRDDRYIPLIERYELARRAGAALFVSVHADAAPTNDAAHGATIYTLSEVASDREAALLAERENRAAIIAGETLAEDAGVNRILIDLAQRETTERSADFARILQREASAFFPFRPEWHRFASLIVLKAPDMPSILFESGYLTNTTDAAYISSAEGQKQIAAGMKSAIETYLARASVAAANRR